MTFFSSDAFVPKILEGGLDSSVGLIWKLEEVENPEKGLFSVVDDVGKRVWVGKAGLFWLYNIGKVDDPCPRFKPEEGPGCNPLERNP